MKVLYSIVAILVGEVIGMFVFSALRKIKDPDYLSVEAEGEIGQEIEKDSIGDSAEKRRRTLAVVKGLLERLTMLVGLLSGFPHILTAFGALKIGTRLQDEQRNHISNTYFLVGNLTSILLAMLYSVILRWLWT